MINAYGYCYIFCCFKVEFFIRFWFRCHFGHLQIGIACMRFTLLFIRTKQCQNDEWYREFERCDRWWYEDEEIKKWEKERTKTATQRGQQQQRISEWNEYAVESEFNNIEWCVCVCVFNETTASMWNLISLWTTTFHWNCDENNGTGRRMLWQIVFHTHNNNQNDQFCYFLPGCIEWRTRAVGSNWIGLPLPYAPLILSVNFSLSAIAVCGDRSIQFNSVVISILLWELPIHFSCFFLRLLLLFQQINSSYLLFNIEKTQVKIYFITTMAW